MLRVYYESDILSFLKKLMLNVKRYDNIKEIDNLEIAEGKYGKIFTIVNDSCRCLCLIF